MAVSPPLIPAPKWLAGRSDALLRDSCKDDVPATPLADGAPKFSLWLPRLPHYVRPALVRRPASRLNGTSFLLPASFAV
jgi:hypothetical protein